MSLRFRKRMKLAPGVHLNLSKRGVGVSAGPRGAKVGVGARGGHWSLGAPGTGLYFRKDAIPLTGRDGKGNSLTAGNPGQVQIVLSDDGSVSFFDHDRHPLPPKWVKVVREQSADEIQEFLEESCDKINEGRDAILGVHLATPDPRDRLRFQPLPFGDPEPPRPEPKEPGLIGKLFESRRQRIAAENARRIAAWESDHATWKARFDEHEPGERTREGLFHASQEGEPAAMENLLESQFADMQWPRDTLVSFQVEQHGRRLWLDVDLPTESDMPRRHARPAARGIRLVVKDQSETQIRKDYMQHVHGVLFRVVGEGFRALPSLDEVIASAFTQIPDRATGEILDEYLISARVPRRLWEDIVFDNLSDIDVVASFERFELRRKMTKTAVFKVIEPFRIEGGHE